MVRKILSEHTVPGKWREIIYSDGVTQITYSNDGKQRIQEWDELGNLKSVEVYTNEQLENQIIYDLDSGFKTSEMHLLNGVKCTKFYKEGIPDFTLKEYPDGRVSCISHKKVKKQLKMKLLSLFQKSKN